jgi:hypothetical protein
MIIVMLVIFIYEVILLFKHDVILEYDVVLYIDHRMRVLTFSENITIILLL